MRPRLRVAWNWAVVVLLTLFFGGVLALGILHEQIGEVLFNGTLV